VADEGGEISGAASDVNHALADVEIDVIQPAGDQTRLPVVEIAGGSMAIAMSMFTC
jgi:hypothetical protein